VAIVPFINVLRKVSFRIVIMPIQSQGIITRDGVSVDVSAASMASRNRHGRALVRSPVPAGVPQSSLLADAINGHHATGLRDRPNRSNSLRPLPNPPE
jgi:regulator of protease activity HflC (stomatin/prohibitin superfamily)